MKIPPHNNDIEMSVLSTCLMSDASDICDMLTPADFYSQQNAKIFSAIKQVNVDGKVDVVMVNDIARCGSYISKIMSYPVCTSIEDSCSKLKELSAVRELIVSCSQIMAEAYETKETSSLLDKAQTKIINIQCGNEGDNYKRIGQICEDRVDYWERIATAQKSITGVPSGYGDMDRITAGWQPGELIILAARSGMGKTSLALNMARNAAGSGYPAAFFSLEMTKEILCTREVSRDSRINGERFRSCGFSDNEWSKINSTVSKFSELPLYVDDTPSIHYAEIRRKTRKLVKDHGVKIVFVDYLQLARGDRELGSREQEVGSISRGLKALSKNLSIPVVALAQLNRDLEKRTNKRPILADLRESGSIEQDADIVVFIYRDEYYKQDSKDAGKAEVIFAKNRNGPTGRVWLAWVSAFASFENLYRSKHGG